MHHCSLFNQLYLRANSCIVQQLGVALATDIAESKSGTTARAAEAVALKRKRTGAAAQMAADVGMAALHSGQSLRPKRKSWQRTVAMSDGEDEVEAVLAVMNREAAAAAVTAESSGGGALLPQTPATMIAEAPPL
jgi:hypothetical protein